MRSLPQYHAGPQALQDARRTAKRRFIEIAVAETPPDVRFIIPRSSLSGAASRLFGGGYQLKAPRPFTRKALYIYLHECAHIACLVIFALRENPVIGKNTKPNAGRMRRCANTLFRCRAR